MEDQTIIRITKEPLVIDSVVRELNNPSTGAMAIFTGLVRGITQQKEPHETIELHYEAYDEMAEKMMERITREMRTKWPQVQSIAIIQRVGDFAPGTPTVVIVCSSEHRDSGIFDAAKYGIDRLKQVVPIWKKEILPDGSKWVHGNHQPDRNE